MTSTPSAEDGGFWAWLMSPERRGAMLVTPALAVLFVMNIFPLLWSFGLSFFNYRANRQQVPEFRGFYYYEKVLTDDKVWERFQTTAVIVSSSVLLQLIIGFLLALLFAKAFPMRRILLMLVRKVRSLRPLSMLSWNRKVRRMQHRMLYRGLLLWRMMMLRLQHCWHG